MTAMTISEVKHNPAGAFRRVATTKRPMLVTRGKKTVAIIVPPGLLQEVEDREDIRDADQAMASLRAGKSSTIPWARVRAARA